MQPKSFGTQERVKFKATTIEAEMNRKNNC